MHNCPSCKKLTSNLLTPIDGVIKEDICDECTVIALSLCAPDFTLFEEELMFSAIDALAETAYQ